MTTQREKDYAKWKICDVRYVRWNWVIAGVVGTIGIISTLAFSAGSWGTKVEQRVTVLEEKCIAINRVDANLDTIKVMLRNK